MPKPRPAILGEERGVGRMRATETYTSSNSIKIMRAMSVKGRQMRYRSHLFLPLHQSLPRDRVTWATSSSEHISSDTRASEGLVADPVYLGTQSRMKQHTCMTYIPSSSVQPPSSLFQFEDCVCICLQVLVQQHRGLIETVESAPMRAPLLSRIHCQRSTIKGQVMSFLFCRMYPRRRGAPGTSAVSTR
jgi:hypothetical protein